MQDNATPRMFRVKAVAEQLDVSVATIYRAIENGELCAVRMGTGKGALRIPEDAIAEYIKRCKQAAATAMSEPKAVA
ncbi:helix-turn-helix domain-containing protein [Crossiella sp. CA-258035]|uniref:helix-turn-helix domain-containing protein n=1 Tax=Crossiella sp. CA-258035 TaxID=2981138 RepID=UPI0024BC57D6|nr:helix-turn-helix domain-containing protein [Crossiella sp. CA-258035]WHT21895.1 helix-turn-helix domain-containing protein [Crossiella sp. CA-258035]